MIITPKCPHCGETVKIDVKKVDRLELENAELKKRITTLEFLAKIKSDQKSSYDDLFKETGFGDLFGDKEGFFGKDKKK